jgi:anti-sigma factor RsiW
MNCHEFEKHIIDYLEGNLPDGKGQEMAQHLKECDACNTLYSQVAATYRAFDEALVLKTDSGFTEEVTQKTRALHPVKTIKMAKIIQYAAAAIILLFVSLSGGIMIGTQLHQKNMNTETTQETAYYNTLATSFYLRTDDAQSFESYLIEQP